MVRKTVPSAFFGTSLAAWLSQRGVQTLAGGGRGDQRLRARQRGRRDVPGFRPLVVSDCVGDRALGPHEANLFDMAQKYAAVMPLESALKATA